MFHTLTVQSAEAEIKVSESNGLNYTLYTAKEWPSKVI